MNKSLQILNIVALVATIGINYLSNNGLFNGETMATISGKYHNLFTPAGYAFSIWGLIFIGLCGFVFYYGPFTRQTKAKEKILSNVGWWFTISCVANCLWVITWLYEYTLLTIPIMVLLFVALLKIITNTRRELKIEDWKTSIFFRLPFYIYSGWISVALIANVAAYLKKVQWAGFGVSETLWTIVMFSIAALIHLFMIWKRNMVAFGLVSVWALIAIAMANKPSNHTVYLAAIVTAIILFVNAVVHIIKKSS
ncbi:MULTISPECIES: tryptophan-rich sensory protein [Sphingobacterium]|uniref:tryptophan-rich sensory protein n=1 Tax=Sphingobacterium TaxID=28453 RepID=UPI0013DBAD5F|nr:MULTISPECIES: tryptophan-rich sensory protein [unclassified Sphingobacterium]